MSDFFAKRLISSIDAVFLWFPRNSSVENVIMSQAKNLSSCKYQIRENEYSEYGLSFGL